MSGTARRVMVLGVAIAAAVVFVMLVFEPFASGPAGGSSSSTPRRAYVGNGFSSPMGSAASQDVSGFSIGANGSLSTVTGSPFGLAGEPAGLVVGPNGAHLYATNTTAFSVSRFLINDNGALSGLATGGYIGYPGGLAITPDGARIYVGDSGSGPMGVTGPYGYNVAADGSLSPVQDLPTPISSTGASFIAITPSGANLYVVANFPQKLFAFDIAANGTLSEVTGSPWNIGNGAGGPAITPDGKYIYVPNRDDNNITAYAIGAGGALSEVSGSPFATSAHNTDVAASPDGSLLYAANQTEDKVAGFHIAADGRLTAVTGSPFAAGAGPTSVELTPDGAYLYTANLASNDVSAFSVAADGALTAVSGSPFATSGTGSNLVAITPDQGPTASFAVAGSGSRTRSFDGSSSSDPDGTVARYDWDFGDGATLPNGGPAPSHTYPSDGTFTATLTVTDDENCSTRRIYTGQMTLCNGGSRAATSQQVVVTTPATQPPSTSTGQRAAALKKCKKKKSAPARKKCKQKAKKLPL